MCGTTKDPLVSSIINAEVRSSIIIGKDKGIFYEVWTF